MNLSLDKRWCDSYDECTNTQTVREWIHDIYNYIYGEEIILSDSELDKMTQEELEDFVDELDWLASK